MANFPVWVAWVGCISAFVTMISVGFGRFRP